MPPWIKMHNGSLSSVRCVATEDQLILDFDVDISKWKPVNQTFPLFVRLFDKNGQHLTHFTTAEGFTVFIEVFDGHNEIYQRFMQNGVSTEASKYKWHSAQAKRQPAHLPRQHS